MMSNKLQNLAVELQAIADMKKLYSKQVEEETAKMRITDSDLTDEQRKSIVVQRSDIRKLFNKLMNLYMCIGINAEEYAQELSLK